MIPIQQTQFGSSFEDPATVGNCQSACIASILELPLHSVPNFMEAGEDGWWKAQQQWLESYNLAYMEYRITGGEHPKDVYYVCIGKSPRGNYNHACVYRNGTLAHDPHPSGMGLKSEEFAGLLLHLDPSLTVTAGSTYRQGFTEWLDLQRGTGRTTRLLQNARDLIAKGKRVYFLCRTQGAANHIKRMAVDQHGRDVANNMSFEVEDMLPVTNLDIANHSPGSTAHPNCKLITDHQVVEGRLLRTYEKVDALLEAASKLKRFLVDTTKP